MGAVDLWRHASFPHFVLCSIEHVSSLLWRREATLEIHTSDPEALFRYGNGDCDVDTGKQVMFLNAFLFAGCTVEFVRNN